MTASGTGLAGVGVGVVSTTHRPCWGACA